MSNENRNPFRNFSVKEIEAAERSSYYLIVGNDLFLYNGQILFDRNEVNFHYRNMRSYLKAIADGDDRKTSDEAVRTLATLKILQLRVN